MALGLGLHLASKQHALILFCAWVKETILENKEGKPRAKKKTKKKKLLHVWTGPYAQLWTTLTPVELCIVGAHPRLALSPALRTHVSHWAKVKQHLITVQLASVCLRLWSVEIVVLAALIRQTNRWTTTGLQKGPPGPNPAQNVTCTEQSGQE